VSLGLPGGQSIPVNRRFPPATFGCHWVGHDRRACRVTPEYSLATIPYHRSLKLEGSEMVLDKNMLNDVTRIARRSIPTGNRRFSSVSIGFLSGFPPATSGCHWVGHDRRACRVTPDYSLATIPYHRSPRLEGSDMVLDKNMLNGVTRIARRSIHTGKPSVSTGNLRLPLGRARSPSVPRYT
jgi:uncharacterized protein (UPF0248 family)